MSDAIHISAAADVTPATIQTAIDVFEGFFDHDEPIDWFSFFDRLEAWGWCVTDVLSPAAKKIQREVRKWKAGA
jgi:hypothetical protein